MTLFEEIQAKCTSEEIALGNYHEIATKVSLGRTKPNNKEVGIGTIIEVLGLNVGNAFLDLVYANPAFRYVKVLVNDGRLTISSPLVAGTLASLVGVEIATGVTFTQDHANALLAVGQDPAPVSWQECNAAVDLGV